MWLPASLAGYFGLDDVSSRIDAAFNETDFTIVSDNEHILYVCPELREALRSVQLPSGQAKPPAMPADC